MLKILTKAPRKEYNVSEERTTTLYRRLYRQNMETHHPFHDISVDGQDQSQKPGQSELKQRTTYRYSVKRRGTPEDKLQVQCEA